MISVSIFLFDFIRSFGSGVGNDGLLLGHFLLIKASFYFSKRFMFSTVKSIDSSVHCLLVGLQDPFFSSSGHLSLSLADEYHKLLKILMDQSLLLLRILQLPHKSLNLGDLLA